MWLKAFSGWKWNMCQHTHTHTQMQLSTDFARLYYVHKICSRAKGLENSLTKSHILMALEWKDGVEWESYWAGTIVCEVFRSRNCWNSRALNTPKLGNKRCGVYSISQKYEACILVKESRLSWFVLITLDLDCHQFLRWHIAICMLLVRCANRVFFFQ